MTDWPQAQIANAVQVRNAATSEEEKKHLIEIDPTILKDLKESSYQSSKNYDN
jgi:hypothetical protein